MRLSNFKLLRHPRSPSYYFISNLSFILSICGKQKLVSFSFMLLCPFNIKDREVDFGVRFFTVNRSFHYHITLVLLIFEFALVLSDTRGEVDK